MRRLATDCVTPAPTAPAVKLSCSATETKASHADRRSKLRAMHAILA